MAYPFSFSALLCTALVLAGACRAESAPRIPAGGALEITSWSTQDPDFKVVHTLRLRRNAVSGTSRASLVTPDGSCSPVQFNGTFNGTIQDNVISGEDRVRTNAVTCSEGGCITVIRYDTVLPERRMILNPDGSLSGFVRGSRSVRTVTTSGCSEPDNVNNLRSANEDRAEFSGTWRTLRK